MVANYQIDFDQVAQVGRNTRHRPTFPLRQLDHAVDKDASQSYTVQQNRRHHHGELLPVVSAGGVEITCSKRVPDG